MTTEKNSIENFLQSVCRFVCTEERAQDIRDELKDHIDSYIDEYTNDGMTIEDATSKALNQMGDPYSLSSTFKDNNNYYYKRIFIIGLIISFLLMFLSINIYAYINNIYRSLDMIFLIACIISITPFIKTYKKSKKLIKNDPIFYIQCYKESTWYENASKPMKWIFIILFLIAIVSYLTEFKDIPKNEISYETLNTIRISATYLFLIILSSCSNPIIQNNIVYAEGILTSDSFIPWDNIAGYRWVKEHSKNKVIYSIEIKFKNKSSYNYSFHSQLIKVSSYQINLVDEIFKTNNIEQRQCF